MITARAVPADLREVAIGPELRLVLRSLGASRRQTFTKVGVPRALPVLFASLKIAVSLAFVGSVIA